MSCDYSRVKCCSSTRAASGVEKSHMAFDYCSGPNGGREVLCGGFLTARGVEKGEGVLREGWRGMKE
jgi:hypothetical protein